MIFGLILIILGLSLLGSFITLAIKTAVGIALICLGVAKIYEWYCVPCRRFHPTKNCRCYAK